MGPSPVAGGARTVNGLVVDGSQALCGHLGLRASLRPPSVCLQNVTPNRSQVQRRLKNLSNKMRPTLPRREILPARISGRVSRRQIFLAHADPLAAAPPPGSPGRGAARRPHPSRRRRAGGFGIDGACGRSPARTPRNAGFAGGARCELGPRRGCAHDAPPDARAAPSMPRPNAASVLTIGTRPRAGGRPRSRDRGWRATARRRISRIIMSVRRWSALLITITSGISITPAFAPGSSHPSRASAPAPRCRRRGVRMCRPPPAPPPRFFTNTSSRPAASTGARPAAPPRRVLPARRGWPSSG